MESLVNYGSDDESGDYNDFGKNNYRDQQRIEEDANYDEIGMDESSEESNNNHAEGHFSKEKPEGNKSENSKDSTDALAEQTRVRSNFQLNRETNSKSDGKFNPNEFFQDKRRKESWNDLEVKENKKGILSTKNEVLRRHSSDMEMDDGEDDLDNYTSGDSKYAETVLDYRQKFFQKNINFTKGKNLGEETNKKYEFSYPSTILSDFNDKNSKGFFDSKNMESENSLNSEESQRFREDKIRKEIGKDSEDRKKEEHGKKDDRESKKREEDKWRDIDRDRKRESEKYRDDKDRRKSPDRREYSKKRSHSPDKKDRDSDRDRDRGRSRDRERERDRDRDRDRNRDRDRSRERIRERDRDRDRERDRDRDRDRDCDRDRDRDRERDKERDRDRDRDYRSGDRRSPKHSRRNSGSPERSWKTRKLEKKAAVLNKLGIELKADVTGNMTPRQLLGEQLKAQIQEVEAKTGVTLPTYYNPGVMNPLKYAQQIQKRKLLWGNKSNETKTNDSAGQGSSVPSTVKQWEAATFKGDSDGKMTEKFKRLMGIKGDTSGGDVASSGSKPPETKEIIQKQEEMFSNMEAQYQVARMATHTHRGVGLGFGTFQVPPR